ncbi:Rpn family recombination-promoting nuclease/putative transposase, partial [Halorhodospira halochloris]|uniref:Rpn family recombination-promoting nuclease/putative transposase n=1 Tax=Halorhodospira halochloris TaxID=1052 RepID=UPI001EE8EACB
RERLADDLPEPLPGSFVEPSLRKTYSDRLFRAWLQDGCPVFIYVLIEHKSDPEPKTPLQLLGYMQRIWLRYVEDKREGQAELARNLPPIIPLVIYNGSREWNMPLSLLDCIKADEQIRQLQSHFGYQLRHLRADEADESYSQDPQVRSVFRAMAWAYLKSLSRDQLEKLLEDLPSGHPLEKPLLVYLIQVHGNTIEQSDLNYAVTQNRSGERAEELTMAVAEEWRQEGRLESKASDLLRLIERKFGSQAKRLYKERVEKASLEQLDHWFDRAIDAARVENVFAED